MYNSSLSELRNESFPVPIPDYCGPPQGINDKIIVYIEGYLLSIVGIIGVFANMMTFYVLLRIESKNNIFNKLLMQLVTGDSISILLMFVDFSLRKHFEIFSFMDEFYIRIWPTIIYPFIKLSVTWIMCCTMAITIERYLAICHPFMVRGDSLHMSVRRSRSRRNASMVNIPNIESSWKRLYKYTFFVLIISIVSTIPIFFEFERITNSESKKSEIDVTNLRTNANYVIFYKNGFEGIFLVVLPFVVMVCLNAKIICRLANTRNIRGFGSEQRAKKEMNLAKVLIAMDLAFLLSNLGRVTVNLWEISHVGKLEECLRKDSEFKVPPYIMTIMSVNHFLLVLKSSINFVILSITGSEFRRTLCRVFGINEEQATTNITNSTTVRAHISIDNHVPENTQSLNMSKFRETRV